MWVAMRRRARYLRFGRPAGFRTELRRLLTPALASGAFPLGFALTLQGMVILVGVVLGPAAAAVFSTLRTLSRAVIQLLGSVSAVVMPEVSKAFAQDDITLLRSLNRRACQVALWIAIPMVAVLAALGAPILHAWTSGKVGTQGSLLYLFLAITVVDTFWYTNMAVLIATNRHQRVATDYAIACTLTLPLGAALLNAIGLSGGAIALLALELVMAVVALRRTLPAVHDRLRPFAAAVARPPWYVLATISTLRPRSWTPR
jgi:O-antigen/teichoic acid export membrane protein